jgi:2-deoxy-D-gluconate 3-dehydrogenase
MNSQNIFSIEGLNTVVTGAAMGIGFAIAQRFVDAGANALLVDVDEGALRSACDKLSKPGTPGIGKVASLAIDLGSDGAGESLVRRCVEKFGSIDLLVNNAGIYPQVPILKMTPEVFDRVIRVNLRGLVMASRAAGLELVKQGRGGGIINVASVDSLHPSMVGLGAYDASKGGVLSFTKSLALELAPSKVRVNAILPGGIATEGATKPLANSGLTAAQMAEFSATFIRTKVPMGRMGEPGEIASVAQFLASPAAAYMTGSAVTVDGGMLLT